MDVQVTGADKLATLGAAVRKMGADRTILKALTKRVKALATPIRAGLRASALALLPHRGGLGAWVAKSRVTVSVRRGTTTAGVTIKEGRNSKGGRSDLVRLDQGTLRHPQFGNRHTWYPQRVTPGFATKVIEGPITAKFVDEVDAAIDVAIAEVLRGL